MFNKLIVTLFIICFCFMQNAYANQPIIVISSGEKEQVYKVIKLSAQNIHELSSNSLIELIFSPNERLTLKRGKVVSYTYITEKENSILKRVAIEQSNQFQSSIEDWKSELDIFLVNTSKTSKILSIDDLKVSVEYKNAKYILRVK